MDLVSGFNSGVEFGVDSGVDSSVDSEVDFGVDVRIHCGRDSKINFGVVDWVCWCNGVAIARAMQSSAVGHLVPVNDNGQRRRTETERIR